MTRSCPVCDRTTCQRTAAAAAHRAAETDPTVDVAEIDRRWYAFDAARKDCTANAVNWRDRCLAAESRATSIEADGMRWQVFREIEAERVRQDAKWGGPAHDDEHTFADWIDYIKEHTNNARFKGFRIEMVKIAALAIAAIESTARKTGGTVEPIPAPSESVTMEGVIADTGDGATVLRMEHRDGAFLCVRPPLPNATVGSRVEVRVRIIRP